MLIIEPAGGLCNRMRAMDSAIALAKKIRRPLQVNWYSNPSLNCRFDALFEAPPILVKIQQADLNTYSARLYRKISPHLATRIRGIRLDQANVEAIAGDRSMLEDLARYPSIYIYTYSRFYKDSSGYLDFKPIRPLTTEIDSFTADFGATTGVHVRRGDHGLASEQSPISAFVKSMKAEIERMPDTRFFLATDSPEDEQLLRRTFPERIISYPKHSYDRNEPRAIQDALIDLFCLSRCRHVIGSYWSSFSETAAEIGDIDLSIATSNPQKSKRWPHRANRSLERIDINDSR